MRHQHTWQQIASRYYLCSGCDAVGCASKETGVIRRIGNSGDAVLMGHVEKARANFEYWQERKVKP